MKCHEKITPLLRVSLRTSDKDESLATLDPAEVRRCCKNLIKLCKAHYPAFRVALEFPDIFPYPDLIIRPLLNPPCRYQVESLAGYIADQFDALAPTLSASSMLTITYEAIEEDQYLIQQDHVLDFEEPLVEVQLS